MFGLNRSDLTIVDYDPDWVSYFQTEAQRLNTVSRKWNAPWEHIGSTAVESLSAKPIIDMMIGLASSEVEQATQALQNFGYEPGGFLYSKTDFLLFKAPEPITHIVHIVHKDSQEYLDKLQFRDLLRNDPKVRKAYESLKIKVARRMGDNRKDYGRYKAHFIQKHLRAMGNENGSHPKQ